MTLGPFDPKNDRIRRLGELLIEAGSISDRQLNAALNEQRKWGGRLGGILVEMGFLEEKAMMHVLARQLGLSTVDLESVDVSVQVTQHLKIDLAERYGVFPLRFDTQSNVLAIATADPTNADAVQELEFATGAKIAQEVASASAIDRAIRKYYFGEDIVATQTVVSDPPPAQRSSIDDTDAEAAETAGLLQSANPRLAAGAVAEPYDLGAIKEQIHALEQSSRHQIAALRSLVDLLIRSGLITREEYLERLHRPE